MVGEEIKLMPAAQRGYFCSGTIKVDQSHPLLSTELQENEWLQL
jgi:hypothetical protein